MGLLQTQTRRKTPVWYQDAKLGIIVHWGLYSIPAWAPKSDPLHQVLPRSGWRGWFKENPRAEWYQNSIEIEGSPSRRYHEQKYGKNFDYDQFASHFMREIKKWDSAEWVDLFSKAGARYIVFTAKHHDGFLLWDSKHPNPYISDYQTKRDVVGEFTDAARKQKLRMGIYYSGGLDWAFKTGTVREFHEMFTGSPDDQEFAGLVMDHYRELIARYKPSILWNDTGFPVNADLAGLVREYYEKVKDGLINDRFTQVDMGRPGSLKRKLMLLKMARVGRLSERNPHEDGKSSMAVPFDFHAGENRQFREPVRQKWEAVCSLGNSFGYNQNETDADLMSVANLIHTLVDVVSKNGNLLINIGPKADGTIPNTQKKRLQGLGVWLAVNGEAIYGTRACFRAEGVTTDGIPVRFTRKGNALYAILLGDVAGREIELENIQLRPSAKVTLPASGTKIKWEHRGNNLYLELPTGVEKTPALVIRMQLIPESSRRGIKKAKEQ